jgi:Leucine-rich repeat (LRR) protein
MLFFSTIVCSPFGYEVYLDLSDNELAGEIPSALYNPYFVAFLVRGNSLSGSLASEIGLMTDLQELNVGDSEMQGEIPTQLFDLMNLKTLQLNDANFSGPLSNDGFLKLAPKLEVLWLQGNKFEGLIPIGAIDVMYNLRELRLEGNNLLNGTITESVCSARGTAPTELTVLTVDCGKIKCFEEGCCDGC